MTICELRDTFCFTIHPQGKVIYLQEKIVRVGLVTNSRILGTTNFSPHARKTRREWLSSARFDISVTIHITTAVSTTSKTPHCDSYKVDEGKTKIVTSLRSMFKTTRACSNLSKNWKRRDKEFLLRLSWTNFRMRTASKKSCPTLVDCEEHTIFEAFSRSFFEIYSRRKSNTISLWEASNLWHHVINASPHTTCSFPAWRYRMRWCYIHVITSLFSSHGSC